MDEFGVEMNEVERILAAAHLVHHREMRGEIGLEARRIEPDRLIAHGDQLGTRPRVGAREQGHLVTEFDQSLCQEGNDALGAAIKLGRNRLVQRRNLGNLHLFPWPERPAASPSLL
jgi:hypothetical protein